MLLPRPLPAAEGLAREVARARWCPPQLQVRGGRRADGAAPCPRDAATRGGEARLRAQVTGCGCGCGWGPAAVPEASGWTGKPLERTRTRARTLDGGDTWPQCHDGVTRRGKRGRSCGPLGWRTLDVGAREGVQNVGSCATRLREASWSPWMRRQKMRRVDGQIQWAALGAARPGHWFPDFAFQEL